MVQDELAKGLGSLRQLPAAIAEEVVEEMRAAALQRQPPADTSVGGSGLAAQLQLQDSSAIVSRWEVCTLCPASRNWPSVFFLLLPSVGLLCFRFAMTSL